MKKVNNLETLPFELSVDKNKIKYFGYTSNSKYITCKDGVKLATSYFLPKKLEQNKKIPTILRLERYWRHPELRRLFKWIYGKNCIPVFHPESNG